MKYQPGDIFFTKISDAHYTWYHKLALSQIKNYQKLYLGIPEPANEIVHIGLVTDWPNGIHSTGSTGVSSLNIEETYPNAIIKRHSGMTPEKSIVVLKEASKFIDRKYDNWANVKFALPLLFMLARKVCGLGFNYERHNCIGYVISAMRAAGLSIGWVLDPESITPGMEFLDPVLVDIDDTGHAKMNMQCNPFIPSFVTKAMK